MRAKLLEKITKLLCAEGVNTQEAREGEQFCDSVLKTWAPHIFVWFLALTFENNWDFFAASVFFAFFFNFNGPNPLSKKEVLSNIAHLVEKMLKCSF